MLAVLHSKLHIWTDWNMFLNQSVARENLGERSFVEEWSSS